MNDFAKNTNVPTNDCISRQTAINALWKALYEYEDKTEKQFLESEELDVADWFQHRIFVQNMSDIDRQTILNLPSAQPERKKGRWIVKDESYWRPHHSGDIQVNKVGLYCSECNKRLAKAQKHKSFCPNCGADMREVEE